MGVGRRGMATCGEASGAQATCAYVGEPGRILKFVKLFLGVSGTGEAIWLML
jgi:hypothetical protein